MHGKSSESTMSGKVTGDTSLCQENSKTKQEIFKLTFYPDKADPLDKEKMQKIWNHIESETRCQEKTAPVQIKKEKSKCFKNDEKIGKEDTDLTNEEKREREKGTDDTAKSLEILPIVTAIELLDHFRELHMIEDYLKWTAGQVSQSDCLHCPPADCFQAKLDDERQMKHYEEQKIITQVIGNRRTQNMSSTKNLKNNN